MTELAYLNGEVTPLDAARVSVNDRSYLFGDGIYEVVRSYAGKVFGLEEHLARLARSAAGVEIALPFTEAELADLVRGLRAKSEIDDALIYIQVSRGVEPRRHVFDPGLQPHLLITVRHLPPMPERYWTQGVTAVTVPDRRWGMCHVKAVSLLPNVLAGHKARQAGADEAVFVRDDGTVTEAFASNLFVVVDGVLRTHPADNRILGGITRGFILDLCPVLGLECREEAFPREVLYAADEVFLTNSVHEVRGLVAVDGRAIGEGRPGRVTNMLVHAYRELAGKGRGS